MLRFKVDENLPMEVAAVLAMAGHDACTVVEQRLGGFSDADVAGVCRAEQRALVTLDLDFANIHSYPPGHYHGIVVLRLARLDKPRILATIRRCLPLFTTEQLTGRLWIVDSSTVRIRG